jgi:mannan endo-1,4-beta-mannosidase
MRKLNPFIRRVNGLRNVILLAFLIGLSFVGITPRIFAETTNPVDEKASPEVRRLLAYLQSVYGKTTLTGMFTPGNSRVVQAVTGDLPAICAMDVSGWNHPIWGDSYRQAVQSAIDEAKEWAQGRGGIVALQYHWAQPGNPRGSAWVHENKDRGPFDLGKAVTPGTEEHRAVLEDLRRTSDYLEQLQKVGVPVLWRPLHEIDGGWFWWTDSKTPENTAKLWRVMFNYMVKERKLHNLIWVYSAAGAMPGLASGASRDQEVAYRKRFYPGDAYVDIAGIDIYPGGPYKDPSADNYGDAFEIMKLVAPGKMLALCECSAIPDPALLAQGPRWLYVMPWFAGDDRNSGSWIKKSYQNKEVTNLSQLPGWDSSHPTPVVSLVGPEDGQCVPAGDVPLQVKLAPRGGPAPSLTLYAVPGLWKNWSMHNDAEILKQPGVTSLGEIRLTGDVGELRWKPQENGAYSIFAVATDTTGKTTLSNVARVATGFRNVAPGNKISVSSDDGHASRIADGELWSWWNGDKTDQQWLELDLQQQRSLSGLSVIWWKARAKTYRIKVSSDGVDWQEVAPESQTDRQLDWQRESDFFRFSPVSARFVRLEFLSRAVDWGGYVIYEVGVYENSGKEKSPDKPTPLKAEARENAEAQEMTEMLRPYLDDSFRPSAGIDKDRPSIRETARKIAEAMPKNLSAKEGKKRKVLVLTYKTMGQLHVPGAGGLIELLREASRKYDAFEVVERYTSHSVDLNLLSGFDVVVLNNISVKAKDEDELYNKILPEYVKNGGGLFAVHGAALLYRSWPIAEYNRLLGGYPMDSASLSYGVHPKGSDRWNHCSPFAIKLPHPDSPLAAAFRSKAMKVMINQCHLDNDKRSEWPVTFDAPAELADELYVIQPDSNRDDSAQVILSVDPEKVPRESFPGATHEFSYAVSWVKNYGKGRVFYSQLGHNQSVFGIPCVAQGMLDGLQFAAGDLPAEKSPESKNPTPAERRVTQSAASLKLDNPIFPYFFEKFDGDEEWRKKQGFASYEFLMTQMDFSKDTPFSYPEGWINWVRGKNWNGVVVVRFEKVRDEKEDEAAIKLIQEAADKVKESGIRLSLYPYTGTRIDTVEKALPLAEKINRDNVGVTLQLIHEIKGGNSRRLPDVIDKIKRRLNFVIVCGADQPKEGEDASSWDWSRLIRPLGEGDFDTYQFVKDIKQSGYDGPFGLICWGLKEPPREHLARSMATWQRHADKLVQDIPRQDVSELWTQVPGRARDIGVDAQGVPWIISADEKTSGGYAVLKREGNDWIKIDGGAVKIGVTPTGDVWTVDDKGAIRSRKKGDANWTDVVGRANEISVSPDGTVWKLGPERVGDEFALFKWDGSTWNRLDGSATHVAVGANDAPWIVKSTGEIFWRNKDQWELQEGMKAADIAVDVKGPAWILNGAMDENGNHAIYQDDGYHGKAPEGWRWSKIPGSATRVVIQRNGTPWILKQDGSIYHLSLRPPTQTLLYSGLRGGFKIAPDGAISYFYPGGCGGLAFDAKGNLFMTAGDKILKFPPGQAEHSVFASGLDRAHALTLDPAGNVYFSEWRKLEDEPKDKPDRKDGEIYKITPTGEKTVFVSPAKYAYGLSSDPQGNIYHNDYGLTNNIYRYQGGNAQKKQTFGPVIFGRHTAIDQRGNMFASGMIVLDPKKPNSVKVGENKWVRDKANTRAGVFKISPEGGTPELFSSSDDYVDGHVTGLAFDSAGVLYSADYHDQADYRGVIFRYAPDGSRILFASGLVQPMWIAFEP